MDINQLTFLVLKGEAKYMALIGLLNKLNVTKYNIDIVVDRDMALRVIQRMYEREKASQTNSEP